MDRLIAHAESLGLYVAYRNLGRANGYFLGGNLVVLNYRRAVTTQRITLAHEIGHWFHGHDWSGDHDHDRDEREADMYAASLLIPAGEYARAEQLVGCHPGALARELGVTARLVEFRRQQLERDARILAVADEFHSA